MDTGRVFRHLSGFRSRFDGESQPTHLPLTRAVERKNQNRLRMILAVAKDSSLHSAFDQIGLGAAARRGGAALIKINLAHAPAPLHPRTDPRLLLQAIQYLARHEANCAIAEGANGFLHKNISKHPGMTFSNNVKLFVGAVPRCRYLNGEGGSPRPRVHADLHRSVANIYRSIMAYAPFHFCK